MGVPQSVVKIDKDGVQYVSSVDRTQYTIRELTRAALRDVGKFVCKAFVKSYYAAHPKKSGRVGKATQYWVKHKQETPELQVGIKANGWYGGYQEFGTSRQQKEGLLAKAVEDNIAEIVKIESQYLSSLEDEAGALSMIDEAEFEGGAED